MSAHRRILRAPLASPHQTRRQQRRRQNGLPKGPQELVESLQEDGQAGECGQGCG